MKAAIYSRVSTEGQEQTGTSLQTQLEACQKYCPDCGILNDGDALYCKECGDSLPSTGKQIEGQA